MSNRIRNPPMIFAASVANEIAGKIGLNALLNPQRKSHPIVALKLIESMDQIIIYKKPLYYFL
jgi:hypothetical protein